MFLYLSLVFLHYAVWFSEFPHHPSPNCVEQLIALAMTAQIAAQYVSAERAVQVVRRGGYFPGYLIC